MTQLIYLNEGQEQVFEAFEAVAIPAIRRYNGSLLLRVRPAPESVIAGEMEAPYEIHLVRFHAESDFEAFKADEERKKFLHLREQSIRSSLLILGKPVR